MNARTRFAAVLSLAVLAGFASTRQAPPSSASKSFTVADLAWMEGDWESAPGAQQVDEHWTHVAGGTLLGVGRTVAKEKTVFFEYLRVETRADGVFYVAQPLGKSPTAFRLVKVEGASAVFENLEHDFPKRIAYRKTAEGELVARIEGDGTETERAQEFRYARRVGK